MTEYLTFHFRGRGRYYKLTENSLLSAIETFFIKHILKYEIFQSDKIFSIQGNVLFPVPPTLETGQSAAIN